MNSFVVSTTSSELADAVFETKLDGVDLSLLLRKSWDPSTTERVFYIGVSLASSVATNVFASWLWDSIKRFRAKAVDIEGRECPHSEEEIAVLVEQIIKEAKRDQSGSEY